MTPQNFRRFDRLDKRQATIDMFLLSQAIEDDLDRNGVRIPKSRLNDAMHARMTFGNKSAYRRGIIVGRTLAAGEQTDQSFISGSDLAKAAAYVLIYRPNEKWDTVRQFLRNKGGEFLQLEQSCSPKNADELEIVVQKAVARVRAGKGGMLWEQIDELMEELKSQELHFTEMATTITDQKDTILKQSKVNAELADELAVIKAKLAKLKGMIDREQDPKIKESMKEAYKEFKSDADKLK